MKPDNNAIVNLYDGCSGLDQNDKLVSTGGSYIGALLRGTFLVLFAAPYDAPVNVVHNDTVLDPQSSVETSSNLHPCVAKTLAFRKMLVWNQP
jgi:hypothetical protein